MLANDKGQRWLVTIDEIDNGGKKDMLVKNLISTAEPWAIVIDSV